MSLRFTILGCGSSMGVPRVALGWGACDPHEPKNRRRRCSLLVERTSAQGRTRALVDCTPDLREQLLQAQVDWLDGVLITHEHADHTHGIDDLRPLFLHKRRRVDVYLDEPTSRALTSYYVRNFVALYRTRPRGSEQIGALDRALLDAKLPGVAEAEDLALNPSELEALGLAPP